LKRKIFKAANNVRDDLRSNNVNSRQQNYEIPFIYMETKFNGKEALVYKVC